MSEVTEIIEEKPKTRYSAKMVRGKLHAIEESGPHQLSLGVGEKPIGTRHTKNTDIIEADDIPRFLAGIKKTRDSTALKIVELNDQKKALENMGILEVGATLVAILKEIEKISGKPNAFQRINRKLFKNPKGKKTNILSVTLNNWGAYKNIVASIELNAGELKRNEENIKLVEGIVKADGAPPS